jgi:N-acetyl-anhydromuramyl-L-alanine amidase AmpD
MNIDKSKKFLEFFDVISDRKIDFLVLHHIEANSVEHAILQLLEHQVSSHFLIDEAGKIFELVAEENVAYHAGVSFWAGCDGLNKTSIGIEFINSSPFEKEFSKRQMQAGAELCQYLIKKYHIKPRNVVGHSDIAYFRETNEAGKQGMLDRKQDPSHLFDWQFMAQNGVGIFPKNAVFLGEEILFKQGDSSDKIKIIKEKLQQFGYKVQNLNNDFDKEMCALARVFNRRFNAENFVKNSDVWYLTSQAQLDFLFAT